MTSNFTASNAKKTRPNRACFYFHDWLDEFLKAEQQGNWIDYYFDHSPGIKDPIEALGVPHTEVELIAVNGRSVDFTYQLQSGDRVSVFPRFVDSGISPQQKLREPLPTPAFVLDVHLGKLARLLRMLGIDAWYRNDYADPELVEISADRQRIVLTRDRRLLFHRRIVHGHFVRHSDPLQQAKEVIEHYQLENHIKLFSRCSHCNGIVTPVNKQDILDRLEPKTILYYKEFYRCQNCGQIYWYGSHMEGMQETLRSLGIDSHCRD